MTFSPLICVVGGYGVVGSHICRLLASRHPQARIVVAGHDMQKAGLLARALPHGRPWALEVGDDDPLAGLEEDEVPDVLVMATLDPDDHVLRAAARRGIPVLDLTRSLDRIDDAREVLADVDELIRFVAASGWMAGAAAVTVAAHVRPDEPAEQVEIDILMVVADALGPETATRFVDAHKSFAIWIEGRPRLVRGLAGPRRFRFSGDRIVRTRLVSSPEQETLVAHRLSNGVTVRLAVAEVATHVGFSVLVGTKIWSCLPRATRRRMLQRLTTGQGEHPHEFWVSIVRPAGGDHRVAQIRVVDPHGQRHLAAASAVSQVERLLGWNGRAVPPVGVSLPESAPDAVRDVEAMAQMGVRFDVTLH
ncbi:hypothetical protein [Nocardioides gilvus]|uniref:hypothetical protein n=1 Tax=Nocardioides gilvus TaxID=1735589 RepID=UPI0013A582F2|nr:hypothetical protein [Nocardioides gilvus]